MQPSEQTPIAPQGDSQTTASSLEAAGAAGAAPGRVRRRPPVWYGRGLRFTCTRCGRCCRDRGVPTYVFLQKKDIRLLADHLRLTTRDLLRQHCERHSDGYVLRNLPGACRFWKAEAGCVVYPARPVQCRTWPFWPSNLRRECWEEAARFCPGCNQGRWHSRVEIEDACREMLGGRGDGSLWPGEIPLPE